MEELKVIYDRVTFLRQKGVKMKDIAERAGMTSSVLSAIYSTVLLAFFKNAEKGMEADEALSQALVWVNNVSKKRFLGSIAALKAAVFAPRTGVPACRRRRGLPLPDADGGQPVCHARQDYERQRHVHELQPLVG